MAKAINGFEDVASQVSGLTFLSFVINKIIIFCSKKYRSKFVGKSRESSLKQGKIHFGGSGAVCGYCIRSDKSLID